MRILERYVMTHGGDRRQSVNRSVLSDDFGQPACRAKYVRQNRDHWRKKRDPVQSGEAYIPSLLVIFAGLRVGVRVLVWEQIN